MSRFLAGRFSYLRGIVSDFQYLIGLTIQKNSAFFTSELAVSSMSRFLGVRFLRGCNGNSITVDVLSTVLASTVHLQYLYRLYPTSTTVRVPYGDNS